MKYLKYLSLCFNLFLINQPMVLVESVESLGYIIIFNKNEFIVYKMRYQTLYVNLYRSLSFFFNSCKKTLESVYHSLIQCNPHSCTLIFFHFFYTAYYTLHYWNKNSWRSKTNFLYIYIYFCSLCFTSGIAKQKDIYMLTCLSPRMH